MSKYIYISNLNIEWSRALDVSLSKWCCSVSMVWVQIPSREEQIYIYLILTLFGLIFRRIYLIFSITLVSLVTLRSSGTDILYGCHLLRCLYNILYILWLYNEFFIILYNILKNAELDCCQIIILSIYVSSTHA